MEIREATGTDTGRTCRETPVTDSNLKVVLERAKIICQENDKITGKTNGLEHLTVVL